MFHGPRLAAFFPSVRVPETFVRDYRKRLAVTWLLLGAKIVAIGALVGLAFILFLRLVRSPQFRWKRLAPPLLAIAPFAAAAMAIRFPGLLRAYPTQLPLSTFEIAMAVALLLLFILLLCAAGVAFALISGARPGWRRSLRSDGLGSAVVRAGVAAVGAAGLARWGELAAARFPGSFGFDPSLPQFLEAAVPSFAILWSAATGTLVAATVAAVAVLAAPSDFFRAPVVRLLALLAILLAIFPTSFHSAGELAASLLPAAISAAWLVLFFFFPGPTPPGPSSGPLVRGRRGGASPLEPAHDDRAAGLFLLLPATLPRPGSLRRLRGGSWH